MAARKRITQRIPEHQRGTEQLKLRVAPEIATVIRERGQSAYVTRLVREDMAKRAPHQSSTDNGG